MDYELKSHSCKFVDINNKSYIYCIYCYAQINNINYNNLSYKYDNMTYFCNDIIYTNQIFYEHEINFILRIIIFMFILLYILQNIY